MKQLRNMFCVISSILCILWMAGCGSSSTPVTVSGTALAGAPVVGKAYIKDSSSPAVTKSVDIDKNGNFTFDVTGMKAPFILKAEGTVGSSNYSLTSMATGAGTANINPITNLAVAVATGKDPAEVYADPVASGAKTAITDASVATAVAKIKEMLAPILATYDGAASVDPLKSTIVSTNTGMDGVFDVVKIDVSKDNTGAPQVSVTNSLTAAPILPPTSVNDAVADTDATKSTITTGTDTLSVDAQNLQDIKKQMDGLAAEFNKGASANIDRFVAQNFGVNSGETRDDFINKMNPEGTITGISPLTIVARTDNPAGGYDYQLYFQAYFADGSISGPDDNFIFTKEDGVWKMRGNGYKSEVRVRPSAYRWIDASGNATMKSGLEVQVNDPGAFGINSAIITGPGLPADGLSMVLSQGNVENLNIVQSQQAALPTDQWNFYPLDDATIASNFVATAGPYVYTIVVKDAKGATIETRPWQFATGPVVGSQLTDAFFPALTGISSHDLSLISGKSSLTFSFLKPTAYAAQDMSASVSFWSNPTPGGADFTSGWYESKASLTASQVTIVGTIPAQLSGGWVYMRGQDSNKREFCLNWMLQ